MSLVRDPAGATTKPDEGTGAPAGVRYAEDPFTWAIEQARLLRAGRLADIDVHNIADEIADVAHYLADTLESDVVRIIQHLLKWDHQVERRSRSWTLTIREHRRRVDGHFRKAPGLRSAMAIFLPDAYLDARDEALKETDLPESALPQTCPYSWDDIMIRPIVWHDTQ